jgi:16S rRNA (uracil1498-N3)-methyltransferase
MYTLYYNFCYNVKRGDDMQRYFVDAILGDTVVINGQDAHHITRVLRMNVDDEIICVANSNAYKCKITVIEEDYVEAIAFEQITETNELPFKITLVYGLVKNDKFDFVVQKATELGVDRIVPLRMKRSIVKLEGEKATKRVQR